MFESLVANILNRFLGSFIEGFDPKQLNIGIWSGDVKLRKLQLRKDSLEKFNLPVDVKFGHLGELMMQIPWSNLRTKPVKITIEDIYIVAKPIIMDHLDPEKERQKELKVKRERLEALEAFSKTTIENELKSSGSENNESFTESLITKIVDNLQVTIKNIHVRYEDDTAFMDYPYGVGVTLKELSAVSANEDWVPSFLSTTQVFVRKLLKLKNLSVYMNTNSSSIYSEDNEVMLENFKSSLEDEYKSEHQYLLKPVSGEGKITIHKNGATEEFPHAKAELFFDEFGINLDSQQYREILSTASKYRIYNKTLKYRKLKPLVSVEKEPLRWFKYVARAILNEVHEKNYKWSWEYFSKRRDQRIAYVEIWQSKIMKKTLTREQENQLAGLEEELTYEDIKFYRSLASSRARKENRLMKASSSTSQREEENRNVAKSTSRGWFASWWGGSNVSAGEDNVGGQESLDLLLSQEQREALYDAIEYDEKEALSTSVDIPRDRVKYEAFVTLKKGGASIKRYKEKDLAEVIFEGCSVSLFQRTDSFLANFQLNEFRVEDGTGTTLYKHIVSVKQTQPKIDNSVSDTVSKYKDPFFRISFEQNPLDGSADSKVLGKLKSMTIFYNTRFIEEVMKFFSPPRMHLETVGAIMNVAEATVEGLTTQTRIGLQYALDEHKTMNVKLDLQAPLVILPLDASSWKSPVAIFDAGHLSVTSKLADKAKVEEVKAKSNYKDEDWDELKNLMYDHFILKLEDMQFLVGPSVKCVMEELHADTDENKSTSILDKLNVNLLLGLSIVPDAYRLARIKVGAEVPQVHLKLNDYQYKTLMKIIDASIPKTQNDFNDTDSLDVPHTGGGGFYQTDFNDSLSISSGTTTKGLYSDQSSKQRMIEFDFNVSLIEISLSRCIDNESLISEPLVDLVGDQFKLNFYNTATDMCVDFSLEEVNLIDHIEKSNVPEFEAIVSSNRFFVEERERHKDLFRLHYTRTQKLFDSPNKQAEIFDQNVSVDIATVQFVLSRNSLLSILNFILNTFTETDQTNNNETSVTHNGLDHGASQPTGRINVDVNLESIILILNDDGVKLATLQLSKAIFNVELVASEMEFLGTLGALTLHDEVNQGSPRDSILRNLISIEGNNLAEFKYKTFDKENSGTPYNTWIEFKTGSARINFVEGAFGKIFNFLSQFQRMKAIYDGAREAAINQANNIDEDNKIKFDILIQAPLIVFPKVIDGNSEDKHNTMTLHLGEFFVSNEFKKDGSFNVMTNIISSGIRKVRLSSLFHFNDNIIQSSEMLNDLDISFDIKYLENYVEDLPSFTINGKMPGVCLNLTEIQLEYIMDLLESVSRVLNVASREKNLDEVALNAANANAVASSGSGGGSSEAYEVRKATENEPKKVSNRRKVLFSFQVPEIVLNLYNNTSNLENYKSNKLTSLALNNFEANLDITEDNQFNSVTKVKSFVVKDARTSSENKFREIIPPIKNDNSQFLLTVCSSEIPERKQITIMFSVDSPQMILALDYIFEVKSFFDIALNNRDIHKYPEEQVEEASDFDSQTSMSRSYHDNETESNQGSTTAIGFTVNMNNPSIILLADSTRENTEAVVFKVGAISISSQTILSFAANNIGMFLCAMDDFDNKRLRIIDDFSVSLSHKSESVSNSAFITNIEASIEPMLLRLSLRDILLALNILNKANQLYSKVSSGSNKDSELEEVHHSDNSRRKMSQCTTSFRSMSSDKSKRRSTGVNELLVVIKGEEMNVAFGGLRFVLIGGVQELPVLDMHVKPFELRAVNWSTDLHAEVHLESFVNIYNYSRSTWEPLIEPWPVSVYSSKTLSPREVMCVDFVSKNIAEITLSSHSIALLSQLFSFITTEQELKARGEEKPYRILNQTGYDLEVWIDNEELTNLTRIKNNSEIPWSFQDWKEVRENLNTDSEQNTLGVSLLGSPYNSIRGLSSASEGEELFLLYPDMNGVHNRLSCEIKLQENNVKQIWLKSTITLQNDADVALVIRFLDNEDTREICVNANTLIALPIDLVYSSHFKIRPQIEADYCWSEQSLSWHQYLKHSIPLSCTATNGNSAFYFHSNAIYNSSEPLAKIYPHMRIVISAPLEIENLLPFDLEYRLYDKKSKSDWSGSIVKGVKKYVHVISLESLLLLSIRPNSPGYNYSEFAIVNSVGNSEFKRESIMTLQHENGQILKLKIHYPKNSENFSGLKVLIYCPYVVVNRTGQMLVVSEKGNPRSQVSASNKVSMFSFERDGDRHNRALLKFNDSLWTSPVSFEALGRVSEAIAPTSKSSKEMNMGVTVGEGEGKYKLTNVITVAPRYMFFNRLGEDLVFVENGLKEEIVVPSGVLMPLFGLRSEVKKNLRIKYLHSSKSWSAPFSIDDIGQIYLKLYKEPEGQFLLKVNLLLEGSSIFIQVEDANNRWPFSIRNFSDQEFYIYQRDPNTNDNGEIVKTDIKYEPIFYKIPAKSVMPYAYDYPNAVIKELIIRARGRERAVSLAEIGNLKPFRLPATQNSEQSIVDLNVIADGPVQSLVISNYDPSLSLYKLKENRTLSTLASQTNFVVTENDENYHTRFTTKLEGVGISLINLRFQELCYITIRGIEISYNESDIYQNISVKLKWLQIDNQLFGGIFPLILYPTIIPKSAKEMTNHPSFSGAICKVKDDEHGILFIKYATVLLQEMTIEIDEDFLFALLDFIAFPGAIWNQKAVDKLCDDDMELPQPMNVSGSEDIYFEALHLQPTLSYLSFVRTERVNVEERTSSQNTLLFIVNVLTMAIGNINDAPIKLNALFIENIRIPLPILLQSIQTHYGQSVFYQLHKILGSADFLGNPVGLFNNLASGVLDIFYEPYNGFIMNDRPQELGIGIAKGGLSFLKKSIFGISDSLAKVTGSLAKGLSVITLDEGFQERRRLNQRRNKPKDALYGFRSGANSFVDSFSSGFTGIARNPIEQGNISGPAGFFKGLGKGMVGLPTKTAIGIFDLASNVSEGIRNTTSVFDSEGLDKVRLPRHVSSDCVIRKYDPREAQGQFWLKTMDGGAFMSEKYVAHLLLPGESTAIIVTFKKLILVEINSLLSKWVIPLEEIKAISNEHTGVSISLKRKEGPFIPVTDKESKAFLYKKIGVVVEEYNKRCQVIL